VYDRFSRRFEEAGGMAGDGAAGSRPVAARDGEAGGAVTAQAGGVPSGVGGAAPMSLFTVMLLSQLGTPDEAEENERAGPRRNESAPQPIPSLA
jgi:hypothetical protein